MTAIRRAPKVFVKSKGVIDETLVAGIVEEASISLEPLGCGNGYYL